MTAASDQKLTPQGLSADSLTLLGVRDGVLDYWQAEVRARVAGAREVQQPVLIDTLPVFFDNLVEALTAAYPRPQATSYNTTAGEHGGERARMTTFGPDQLAHEYQIFKESVRAVLGRHGLELSAASWLQIEQSVDTAMREALRAFAERHEGLRHQLAASLSHDMRSPLAVIRSGAELIGLTPSLETAQRTAAKIEANAARLDHMLSELLDALTVEREERLTLTLSEFDIADLATMIAQEYQRDGARRIDCVGAGGVGYWCWNALRRALENLVSNAIKYGDGGLIRIKAEVENERLYLSVHNGGTPLPAEQRARIFDYLRRAHGPAIEGWGVGLPFVRRVAESHGGSVAVDSSDAAGTTFLITLPRDCRATTAAA